MPPVTSQSPLAKKYGQRLDKSVQSHAADETTYGFVNLPPNVQGVAKLRKIYFDQAKANNPFKNPEGEYVFHMSAVVMEPENAMTPDVFDEKGTLVSKGVSIKIGGAQFNGPGVGGICIADRTFELGGETITVSFDDCISDIMNQIRRVGGEDLTKDMSSGADLEETVKKIQESCDSADANDWIYFEFNTTQAVKKPGAKKDPYVKVWWNKKVENYTPPNVREIKTQDETGGGEATGGSSSSSGGDATSSASSASSEEPPSSMSFDESMDILASTADGNTADSKEAQKEIRKIAGEMGMSKDVDDADSWTAGAAMLKEKKASEGKSSSAPAEEKKEASKEEAKTTPPATPGVPKKGDVRDHMIKGADKKPMKTSSEIVAVNVKDKTVDLKSLVDGKTTYKGVKFSDLL